MNNKTCLLLLGMLLCWEGSKAESSLSAYTRIGDLSIGQTYVSGAFFYENQLSSRLVLSAGAELSSARRDIFGAVSVDATVHFPLRGSGLYLSNRIVYHHFGEYSAEDLNYRLALTWRHPHVDLTGGNVFQARLMQGSSIFEVLSPTIEAKGRLKPFGHGWNVSLSIRNFDDFIYEFANWRFGLGGEYRLNSDWKLFGEVVYSPSGVFNFATAYYEMYGKIGFSYQFK